MNTITSKEILSIIVPVYNEQETVEIFYDTVKKHTSQLNINIEFLFVDDGSADNALQIIKDLAKQDERVHYVSFSRNFGKESAIYAGLQNS